MLAPCEVLRASCCREFRRRGRSSLRRPHRACPRFALGGGARAELCAPVESPLDWRATPRTLTAANAREREGEERTLSVIENEASVRRL